MEVNVISHKKQRHAVWFGGSLLASTVRDQDRGGATFRVHTDFCLCFRLNSKATVTPKLNTMNMALASVDTTVCLVAF